jgi:hypothetical protein
MAETHVEEPEKRLQLNIPHVGSTAIPCAANRRDREANLAHLFIISDALSY